MGRGRKAPPREAGAHEPRRLSKSKRGVAVERVGDSNDTLDHEEDVMEELGVPLNAVVKVWCVHTPWNHSLPWQRRRQYRSNSSGFCISRERKAILTNAHCIEHHAQVTVQKRGHDTKYVAAVQAVGNECDCAVLTVADPDFWEGIQVVEFCGKVPRLDASVLCVGFPVGGDTVSVTSGVVSRVEVMTYAQTCAELLGIQIDAAINSGNSGGPAFDEHGRCLGMAFQMMGPENQAENIGYIIPSTVIDHFIRDILKNGRHTGFPTLGVEMQPMENKILRKSFGMCTKTKGILINKLAPTAAAAKHLHLNDVLLKFDNHEVANDGTVHFRKHERVAFSWLVAQKFYGEEAHLTVLRDSQEVELFIENFHPEYPLVPVNASHKINPAHQGPSFLIVAGLVFTTLSIPFLRSEFGEEWECDAPVEIVHKVTRQRAREHGEELVVLTQVLAHELTIGYEDLENVLLETFNDDVVFNLAQVAKAVVSFPGEYFRFGLQDNLKLVLGAEAARIATAEALKEHSIPAAMSQDLVEETTK